MVESIIHRIDSFEAEVDDRRLENAMMLLAFLHNFKV